MKRKNKAAAAFRLAVFSVGTATGLTGAIVMHGSTEAIARSGLGRPASAETFARAVGCSTIIPELACTSQQKQASEGYFGLFMGLVMTGGGLGTAYVHAGKKRRPGPR